MGASQGTGAWAANRPSHRAAVLGASALALLVALAFSLTVPRTFDRSAGVRHRVGATLPPGAEGPVCRALGRDDPAYRAVPVAGGFALRNPRQHLRARFDRHGVLIRSGLASLGLRLRAWGHGDAVRAVGPVRPLA